MIACHWVTDLKINAWVLPVLEMPRCKGLFRIYESIRNSNTVLSTVKRGSPELVKINNFRLEFSFGALGQPPLCAPQRPLPYLFLSGTSLLLSLKYSTSSRDLAPPQISQVILPPLVSHFR